MDKENVIYICERVCMCVSSAIKKKKIDLCSSRGGPYGIVPSEKKSGQRKKQIL